MELLLSRRLNQLTTDAQKSLFNLSVQKKKKQYMLFRMNNFLMSLITCSQLQVLLQQQSLCCP